VVSAGSEGFSLQSEGGDFRLQLRGYIQFDGRFFTGDEDALAVDAFLIRRARPIVQGALGRYFEFNITPDFGGGTATVQDAWLDFRPSSRLRVRVGRFKSPVGLERLQSATATHFVERALPTVVLPNRDVGIEVYGDLAGGVVSYAVAVLDGAPDGGSVDGDVNDGKDLAGRLFVSPFRKGTSSLKGLGLGLAGTTGQQTGPLPSYRSGGQISVLSLVAGVTADGPRNRLSPQLSFYSGPFGVLAEYARSSSRVKTADGTRLEFVAGAWQATAVVAITGDDVSYEGVRPRRPFDPSKGHWGALELAARIHRFQLEKDGLSAELVDPTRSARRISAWGLGLTWSLTRNVKQMGDFDHASFEGGAAAGDRRSENVVFVRTQVSF
jgi:phosphate-selective porin OprO/OprP